jgi:hypothetical protein
MKFETHAKQWHKNVSQPRLRILKAIASYKHIHQTMMLTSEIDMANPVEPANIDTFINNGAWAIHKTYHKISKASPGAATPKQDTIFDVPFVAHW